MTKSELYTKLYDRATKLLHVYDPCEIQTDSNGKTTCVGGKPCCDGCKHLTESGCSVDSLCCRLWLCDRAIQKTPEAHAALNALNHLAIDLGIPKGFRMSKRQNGLG